MSEPTAHKILDRALFEQLFKAHFRHLCHFAQQYVQDADSAKDITQRVFINLWENRERIDPQRSLQTYLFTSVRNRCLNHLRDRKKYRSRILDLDIVEEEAPMVVEETDLAELREKVSAVLATLPEKCRQVFEMSRRQNMKYREIAEELDLSVKTVEAHISRALRSLRAELQDYMHLLWLIFTFFN